MLHCPTCAETLEEEASVDAHRIQLHCRNGHGYHYFLKAVDYGSSVEAPAISPPHFASDVECLRFWLSGARHVLGDPLAELATGILRSYENRPLPEEPSKAQHCPQCGSALTAFDDGDIWVQAMRCAQGHEWGLRGRLLATDGPPALRVVRELTDAELTRGVAEYLGAGQPLLDAMLPPSLRVVFDRFARARSNSRTGS